MVVCSDVGRTAPHKNWAQLNSRDKPAPASDRAANRPLLIYLPKFGFGKKVLCLSASDGPTAHVEARISR